MTLSSATNEVEYTGNGSTTVFAYTFKVHAASHLTVSVVTAGVVSTKVLNTDYTVSGAGSANGGNVTFTSPPASGTTVLIQRTVPLTQTTDLKNQGDFYPETHENAFDRLMMAIQQVNRLALTSLRIPVGFDDFDAGGVKIVDLADGEDATDAATKGQLDDAVTAMQSGMAGGTVASYATGTGNGSSVYLSFPGITVSTASAYTVAVGGVIQRPETDYTIDVANERVVFSTAPGNGVATLAICYGYKRSVTEVDALNVTYQPAGTDAVQSSVRTKLRESVSVKDFGAVGDGVTDDSAAINAATYYLYKTFNGGNVEFPPGVYLCENTLFPRSRVNWIGQATTGYFATGTNGVVIKRASALTILAYQTASLWTCRNIEFEGNSGGAGTYIFAKPPAGIALPADDPLRPGTTTYSLGSGFYLYNCTLSSAYYGIGNSSSIGSINAVDCMFRDFNTAILNTTDSTLDRCLFTGNSAYAISLNTGANRIQNCFFEFQQASGAASHAIMFQSNASELQVVGCRFDRNAGHDIYGYAGAKRPRGILITGCYFNRSAWASSGLSIRAAVNIAGSDDVTVVGNTVCSYSSFPSTVMGVVSPTSLFTHSNCTGVIYRDNNTSMLCREMPLTSASPSTTLNKFGNAWVWEQSASGTDEWYLTDYYNTGNNPYILQPGFVVVNGALLSTGTPGSLAAGRWAWGDNDSLGYSTIYCRVTETGEPGLQDIACYYDNDPYPNQLNSLSLTTRSTDVQTDDWVDVYLNRAHAGRTLVANNATAAISSNVLSITVADGHGIVAGDWLFLDDAVTVSVPDGAYQVLSVTDAGGGNDYINVSRTAADATGTIDIYTVTAEEFTLRTRRRCLIPSGANDFGSMQVMLSVVAHGVTPAYRLNSEWPLMISRTGSVLLPTVINGTIRDHNSNLSHGWYDTSSNDNLSIYVSSDILGDKLTVRVINTTADDIAYQIGIRR